MNIGDVFFSFRGDGARLQKDAQVEGAKAGTNLGNSMAANLKKSWSGKEIGKGLVQGLGLAGGLGAARLFSMAIGKITDVLGDATQAAIAEEVSIQKLGTSLRANVPNWDGQTDAIEKVLQARMKLGFSDDEQRDSLARIVVATKDVNKALAVQRAAMDLSRLKGISLAEAGDALIKIEAGQFRALKALGIQLPKNATAEQALAAVQKAAAGQAEDYAKTNAGKLLVSQVKVDEALEKLGAVTMPLVVEVMTKGAEVATDFADALAGIGGQAKSNDDPLNNLANLLHDMFKSPNEDARTFTGFLFDILNDITHNLENASQALHDWLTFWDSTDEVQHKAANAADHTADSIENLRSHAVDDLRGVSGSMGDVADASGNMAGDIKGDNKAVIVSFQDLRDALRKTAESMVDDVFDPIITADRLRANEAELAAQRAILASKTATAAEKRDARDKIHQLEKDNAEYLISLAEAGATNTKAYSDGITELKNQIKKAKGPAKAALQAILDKILEIEAHSSIDIKVRVSSKTTSGLGPGGKAAGGPVQARVPYIVGERRAEVFVPEVAGRIIPFVPQATQIPAMAGAGAVNETNIVQVQGLLPVRTMADIRRERTTLQDARRLRNGLGRR